MAYHNERFFLLILHRQHRLVQGFATCSYSKARQTHALTSQLKASRLNRELLLNVLVWHDPRHFFHNLEDTTCQTSSVTFQGQGCGENMDI